MGIIAEPLICIAIVGIMEWPYEAEMKMRLPRKIFYYTGYFTIYRLIYIQSFSNYICAVKIFLAVVSSITIELGSFKAVEASPVIIGAVKTLKKVESANTA